MLIHPRLYCFLFLYLLIYIYIFCSTHTHLPLENLRVFSGCCWKRLQCADFLDQILCPPVMAKNKNQAFEPNKLCRLTRTKIHDYSGPNDQSCKFQWNGQGGLYMNINYIYIHYISLYDVYIRYVYILYMCVYNMHTQLCIYVSIGEHKTTFSQDCSSFHSCWFLLVHALLATSCSNTTTVWKRDETCKPELDC